MLGGGGAIAGCHESMLEGDVVRLLGAVDVVPFAGCHFSVIGVGRVTANFGGGAVAGAIVVCYGWGEGDDHLWGSGCRAIAGCHCRVPISVSYLPPIFRATNFTQTPKKTTMSFVLNFLQMLHLSLH